MVDKVNQLPSSPRENPPTVDPPKVSLRDDSPDHGEHGMVTHTPLENLTSVITQGDLDHLRITYSFLVGLQAKIPDDGETILSARSGEVAFYEVAFLAGLKLPIQSTIRRILNFYNICTV